MTRRTRQASCSRSGLRARAAGGQPGGASPPRRSHLRSEAATGGRCLCPLRALRGPQSRPERRMRCLGAQSLVSADRAPPQRAWRPQIYRKCTDPAGLLLFFLFWTGLVFLAGSAVAAGATGRLLFGHDSFGNVCGRRNSPVEGAPLSGQDMTLKKHVFLMDSCGLDGRAGRRGPTALCVASCPAEPLHTLEEVQLFANNTVVSGVLWWLYYDYSTDLGVALDTERDNVACLLGLAVVATVLTAALLVLIFTLGRRVRLAVELLRVTNKAIGRCPALLLPPLRTGALLLLLLWALWVAVLPSLGTAGAARVTEGGRVEYQPLWGLRYMWGYLLLGLVWTSDFILACQHMAGAGAVATCYFHRNAQDPPDRPLLSSLSALLCYHPGSAAKGSLLLTLSTAVRAPHAALTFVSSALQGKPSAWSRCLLRCGSRCLCCLDGHLCHLHQSFVKRMDRPHRRRLPGARRGRNSGPWPARPARSQEGPPPVLTSPGNPGCRPLPLITGKATRQFLLAAKFPPRNS